jgi:uncharacterized protein (DUF2252 family)
MTRQRGTGGVRGPSPDGDEARSADQGAPDGVVSSPATRGPVYRLVTSPATAGDAETGAFEAAWAPEAPTGDVWTPRPWVPRAVRQQEGQAERKRVPRSSHGAFETRSGRDPIAILTTQEQDRLQELVPLRHSRMAESPFTYYRGTPAVMAFDLATTPRTDIIVQAGGDAHCGNFGLFASPERRLVFDANDFDETLPAPWEWDVKRLAASIVIAGRANGFDARQNRAASMQTVRSYRQWMERYAAMRLIDIWYANIGEIEIREAMEAALAQLKFASSKQVATYKARLERIFGKAKGRDQLKAAASLTKVVGGRRVLIDQPPVLQHVELADGPEILAQVFESYRATMAEDRRGFLERYRFADWGLKVVGVGSVGTRCFVVVLIGSDEDDTLILQVKEATASVLEGHFAGGIHPNHGQRVVAGQRLMQSTPDIFLGWSRGPGGRDFYFRQLWDMKGSVDTAALRPEGLGFYGALCAWSLARAHARSGDAVAISAYLGTTDTFDGAVADFSETYADVNERDHRAFVAAIGAGTVSVPPS